MKSSLVKMERGVFRRERKPRKRWVVGVAFWRRDPGLVEATAEEAPVNRNLVETSTAHGWKRAPSDGVTSFLIKRSL